MKLIRDGSEGDPLIILAHGAGAAMDSGWMNDLTALLVARSIRVARFEFPYMAARREGISRPPDRQPVLLQAWRDAIAEAGEGSRAFIGGKSMGGRMATMIADEVQVRGVVAFGYPFHPPGQPTKVRVAHLEALRTPTLVVQGERDEFGTREDVAGYVLSPAIEVTWMPDGDHSFKPRKASGRTSKMNLDAAADAAARFIASRAIE